MRRPGVAILSCFVDNKGICPRIIKRHVKQTRRFLSLVFYHPSRAPPLLLFSTPFCTFFQIFWDPFIANLEADHVYTCVRWEVCFTLALCTTISARWVTKRGNMLSIHSLPIHVVELLKSSSSLFLYNDFPSNFCSCTFSCVVTGRVFL